MKGLGKKGFRMNFDVNTRQKNCNIFARSMNEFIQFHDIFDTEVTNTMFFFYYFSDRFEVVLQQQKPQKKEPQDKW